uniref:Ferritin n=1 Tax=Electrophorus electricus TaxID=8005 RepID=A0A4W4H2M9_ELEEL
MQSAVKHSLHSESEAAINKLINIKLTASYTHVSLGMYSDRHDVALPNFSRFFLELSEKEREQAESLLEYQNLRGGRVLLQNIAKPSREDWKGGLDAFSFSLEYQKSLNNSLQDVHHIASTHTDPHVSFYFFTHETIKKLGDHISILMRLRSSEPNGQMGEYLFDRHTLSTSV